MMSFLAKHQAKKALKKQSSNLRHILHYDDDILDDATKIKLQELIAETDKINTNSTDFNKNLTETSVKLQKILPSKSYKAIREWLDILAVAMAVAFGVRALFFQPFKIPTSSMQPTLFGIHYVEKNPAGNSFIGKFGSFADAVLFSADRAYLKLEQGGILENYAVNNRLFGAKTTLQFNNQRYTLPGDLRKVEEYTNLYPSYNYPADTVLCDGFLSSGDHLFVDRLSHYLTGFKRGDVVVFTTENIKSNGEDLAKSSGFYYIKRLVGIPGDTLKIIKNNLYIRPKGEKNFRHITEFSDKFAKLYSGKGGYQGHSNLVGYAPGNFLGSPESEFTVPENSYFVLGDNTKFSADSRIWGVVPRRNMVGKALLAFWPLSRRWGIIDTKAELQIPTGAPNRNTFKEMYQQ